MEWIKDITKAINYIEDNITEDLSIDKIAKEAMISSFYFQKGFSMLCGFTVGEYVRCRRLTLAGRELISSDLKVIDIALKYGYDSADSFTKAFTRFHGETPTTVRKEGAMIKDFAPLRIKFSLEGGYTMNYTIIEKDEFKVIGSSKSFNYEDAKKEIPRFWEKHYETGRGNYICGMYGINIDESKGGDKFQYIIADDYNNTKEIPDWCVTKVIPKHTWAIFPCMGEMPKAMQEVNSKIFSEWLPNCRDYEIVAGYYIEMYTDASNYPKGNKDENYYSEIWIPVKKK